MNVKKKKKTLCQVYKVSETTSATRFNLLLICPTVPPFVYAALFAPSFQKFEQLFFFWFPSIWWQFPIICTQLLFIYNIFGTMNMHRLHYEVCDPQKITRSTNEAANSLLMRLVAKFLDTSTFPKTSYVIFTKIWFRILYEQLHRNKFIN